jgi:transposase
MGLVTSSYIPEKIIQDLRSLTRTRLGLIQERTQHRNRIHNVLQHANIKLTSFMSDIYKGSGLALLQLLINGEVITESLVKETISKRCKHEPIDIAQSMDGSLSKVQRFEIDIHLKVIETLEAQIEDLNVAIDEITSKYSNQMNILQTIPGVNKRTAEIILAEVGPEVSAFEDAKHLCSWAGICPGSYESGGVRKSAHITQGNRYLKVALYNSGRTAGRSKNASFREFYNRIGNRGSRQKAVIATGHKILRIAYKLLSEYARRNSENGEIEKLLPDATNI